MGPWGPNSPLRPEQYTPEPARLPEPHCWNCCDDDAEHCRCDCPYCDCRYAERLGS